MQNNFPEVSSMATYFNTTLEMGSIIVSNVEMFAKLMFAIQILINYDFNGS